jgi:hypothetical protein
MTKTLLSKCSVRTYSVSLRARARDLRQKILCLTRRKLHRVKTKREHETKIEIERPKDKNKTKRQQNNNNNKTTTNPPPWET